VVCTFSLFAIPDERRAIAGRKRVLRPGGRLLLLDPVTGAPLRVGGPVAAGAGHQAAQRGAPAAPSAAARAGQRLHDPDWVSKYAITMTSTTDSAIEISDMTLAALTKPLPRSHPPEARILSSALFAKTNPNTPMNGQVTKLNSATTNAAAASDSVATRGG
jgi:SAM-dependent methyltransferase